MKRLSSPILSHTPYCYFEWLQQLGFIIPPEQDMAGYLAAPPPFCLEDRKGRNWKVYRHPDFPKDLQVWICLDKSERIRIRQLGRLKKKSLEFDSKQTKKANKRLIEAIELLEQLKELSPSMCG